MTGTLLVFGPSPRARWWQRRLSSCLRSWWLWLLLAAAADSAAAHCHRPNATLWLCVRRSEVVTEITWVGVPLIANASDQGPQGLGQVQGQPDE